MSNDDSTNLERLRRELDSIGLPRTGELERAADGLGVIARETVARIRPSGTTIMAGLVVAVIGVSLRMRWRSWKRARALRRARRRR